MVFARWWLHYRVTELQACFFVGRLANFIFWRPFSSPREDSFALFCGPDFGVLDVDPFACSLVSTPPPLCLVSPSPELLQFIQRIDLQLQS